MNAAVVAVLTYRTWTDGQADGHVQTGQAIVKRLVEDSTLPSVTVVDPFRNWLRVMAGSGRAGFPSNTRRRLARPRRWARGDPIGEDMVPAYRRLERRLRAQASRSSILISCHPVLAALADTNSWTDVVYYGWDDWRTEEEGVFRRSRGAIGRSYEEMAKRDVNVITVSEAIAERIGARRSTVVPSGFDPGSFVPEGRIPDWFAAIRGPVALWVGSIDSRVDTRALVECARNLPPEWTIVLVGPVVDAAPLDILRRLANVVVKGYHPRSQILAMVGAAAVCLLPHVKSPLTDAMSPLKLYEYIAAGTPTVSADLRPIRGISDRIILVPPGGDYASAVVAASRLPPASPQEIIQFRQAHNWDTRYLEFKRAAL